MGLRFLLFVFGSSFWLLICGVFRLLSPAPTRQRVFAHAMRRIIRLGARLYGLRVIAVGEAPAPESAPLLIVSNHRSGLDTLVIRQILSGRSLAKSRVANWPLFGALFRAGGTVFVDRANAGSRVAAIRSITTALDEGANVIVFPEGMTVAGDEVRPFFRGAFHAARGRRVLCLGLAFPPGTEFTREEPMPVYLWKLLWRGSLPVAIAIGEPYQNPRDPAEAALTARRRTVALVARARHTLDHHVR